MTALSEDLQAFLEAERDIDVPAPSARKRMFERLEPLLVVPVAVAAVAASSAVATTADATVATTAGSTAVSVADSASSALLSGALKLKMAAGIVSAALLGGAVGVTGHAYLASPPARPVATVVAAPISAPSRLPERVETTPVETAIVPVPAGSAVAAPSLDALEPSALEPGAPEPGAPEPSAPEPARRPAGSLRAERLLIETASAALMRGDSAAALSALQQHARRFPNGDLAEEREILLAKARAASR